MEYIKDLISNYLLISAFIGWLTAQLIKVIIEIIQRSDRGVVEVLFSTGGMPSSHSSTVVALCTASGIRYGLDSSAFAITFILAMVVMIDASGVRYETGKHAQILNKITTELFSGKPDDVNVALKELVGHTAFQVIMGALLGIVVGVVMAFAMRVI